MKQRMKRFVLTVRRFHESFGGNEHTDGFKDYEVVNPRYNLACKIALKMAQHDNPGYHHEIFFMKSLTYV